MVLSFAEFDYSPIRDIYAPIYEIEDHQAVIRSAGTSGYYACTLVYKKSIEKSDQENLLEINIPYMEFGKKTSVRAAVKFSGENGKTIQTDYLCKDSKNIYGEIRIPDGSVYLTVILMFQCTGEGYAKFRSVSLAQSKPKVLRKVCVASAFIECHEDEHDNLRQVLELINKAGNEEQKPDIICFTEAVYDLKCHRNTYLSDDSVEVQLVCESAKRNNMFVLFTAHEKDDQNYYYNTAFLISNNGEVVGKYRKTQLTLGEYMKGMVPGEDLPVFETPFGKIGVLICWDQWFPEASRVLVSKGAEIIFWLTKGFHMERVVTRARDNGVYYVCANPRPQNCCIIHPTTGKILANGEGMRFGYAMTQIELDERCNSEYKSFGLQGGNDRQIFINERRADLYEQEC